ncbi:hypothetical protein EDS67_23080 [candidate division KSB1 bacterium]|nr:MAG: hypothetical protein EDS67_23080 [candidate division KSB1 bacterium]MBC6947477.1 hypothetical protein [candidate division KSB1 bacterium]MCE7943970.1 hypothetical protein [Chlorobi bacterium CHB1]MDL1879096.1 hypothetical protein [Cytophagia bacterium CHB2]
MKIAIIGAGKVGGALASGWATASSWVCAIPAAARCWRWSLQIKTSVQIP